MVSATCSALVKGKSAAVSSFTGFTCGHFQVAGFALGVRACRKSGQQRFRSVDGELVSLKEPGQII